MEKLEEMNGIMEKIVEILQNEGQIALLLPNGLIEVIVKGKVLFFASMSAMAKDSIGNRIKTDEIIDLTF